ncbi:TetR/AcrR family transcriptional regulator [Massilia sp. IC2-278]|uniref:TetR/AcrR family transcriptional regulator n=1 Tax=Massilia sp. IC2-278 TaxID=2887200 RepID=UPI001E473D44|nr:TetR/AcrR family transcriptional regulator [Massilia sp. IC2-278]MCC2962680.1 TetR/AcrR family transcriptional regulator [Massilia sp. IC2-278]
MKTRSPSVDRICAVAVLHFAEFGYDGSSLATIAEQVGMRKASLYAHFASKDALYGEIFADALAQETAFARACFNDESGKEGTGEAYCRLVADRYRDSPSLRFLLRTAYLPPASLRPIVAPGYEGYLQTVRHLYGAGLLARLPIEQAAVQQFADAYLGIVDSLHVELVYGSAQAFAQRHAALWRILSDSIGLACRKAGG